MSYDDRFRLNCGRLAEFITLRGRLPKKEMIHPRLTKKIEGKEYQQLSEESKDEYNQKLEKNKLQAKRQQHDHYERENACFLNHCRNRISNMKPERIALLDSIHTGLLAPIRTLHRCSDPLAGWEEEFNAWASTSTNDAMRSPVFPSTREPYVSSATSFQEHMVKKSGCHLKFKPSDCCPTKTKPGTMADVFSYALYPRLDLSAAYPQIAYETIQFDDVPPQDYAHHSGTIIQPESTPHKLKQLIAEAEKVLLPNDLIQCIRECKTYSEFESVLDGSGTIFDSFHYGIGGYCYSEVGCILDLKYPQPYRTSFSCTFGPTHYFPSLGTECQELYTYGSPGRPTLDARS